MKVQPTKTISVILTLARGLQFLYSQTDEDVFSWDMLDIANA